MLGFPAGLHVSLCSSAPPHIRVLHTQNHVVFGAGVAVLPQQPSCLQQRCLAHHRHVAGAPGLAVAGGQTDPYGAGAMPHQLLRPGGQGRGTVGYGQRLGSEPEHAHKELPGEKEGAENKSFHFQRT